MGRRALYECMPRIARVVVEGFPLHVTQRGTNRFPLFEDNTDRLNYLRLLVEAARRYGLTFWGYCLMTNHIHLVVVPEWRESVHHVFKWVNMNHSRCFHARHGGSGHLWENRPYSCVLEGAHLWNALAYVENNPVRAGLVESAEQFRWSSAQGRLGLAEAGLPLELKMWREEYGAERWQSVLRTSVSDEAGWERVREATRSGRPLVSEEVMRHIEERLGRRIRERQRGRPRKSVEWEEASDGAQMALRNGN